MAYSDKNLVKNILNRVVISKFESLPPILDIIRKAPEISQVDLRKESGDSNEKILEEHSHG